MVRLVSAPSKPNGNLVSLLRTRTNLTTSTKSHFHYTLTGERSDNVSHSLGSSICVHNTTILDNNTFPVLSWYPRSVPGTRDRYKARYYPQGQRLRAPDHQPHYSSISILHSFD